MPEPGAGEIALNRLIMALIGGAAGLAAYGLIEVLPDYVENERLLLLIVTATGGFFAGFLAATGPLPFARAALAAAVAAVPAAILITWASFRFETVEDFLETGHPLAACAAIVVIGLPFLIAAQQPGRGWRDYPALFTEAWNIVVRYAAAWVFVGVFWGVLMLSHLLLSLVGIEIIEDLIDIDVVPFVLTGLVLGLALAVVVELSDYVSPFLILRLLRLLLPPVLVVTAVFLVALPIQGLSDLFGGISTAATLMGMAVGIATLITSALDRTDDEAAEAAVTRGSAQLLALAMPVLGILALYAIWLRVADHGWTPHRLAAATGALIVLGYGILYALAVALRRNWTGRIRGANVAMALATVAAAVLWLTPLVDPQRISAADQVARFARGDVSAEDLDLWFLGRESGVAGTAALERLAAMDHPGAEKLAARIETLATATSRWSFENEVPQVDTPAKLALIAERLAVRPDGARLPDDPFPGLSATDLSTIAEGCERTTPGGAPGCVLVMADFVAEVPGDEGMLFHMVSDRRAIVRVVWPGRETPPYAQPHFLAGNHGADVTPALIDQLRAGEFTLGAPDILSLRAGRAQIVLRP